MEFVVDLSLQDVQSHLAPEKIEILQLVKNGDLEILLAGPGDVQEYFEVWWRMEVLDKIGPIPQSHKKLQLWQLERGKITLTLQKFVDWLILEKGFRLAKLQAHYFNLKV